VLLAALVSPSKAFEDNVPPTSGKFFYSDLKFTDQWKDGYALETSVGSSRTKLNLKTHTWLHGSSIFTDGCSYPSPCNIQGLYNIGSSKSKKMVEGSEGSKEYLHDLRSG
jgi:hypothetical protein